MNIRKLASKVVADSKCVVSKVILQTTYTCMKRREKISATISCYTWWIMVWLAYLLIKQVKNSSSSSASASSNSRHFSFAHNKQYISSQLETTSLFKNNCTLCTHNDSGCSVNLLVFAEDTHTETVHCPTQLLHCYIKRRGRRKSRTPVVAVVSYFLHSYISLT